MRNVLSLSAYSVPLLRPLLLLLSLFSLSAQDIKTRSVTVNPAGSHAGRQIYERIYVICPMIGAGTLRDPKHPQVAPLEVEKLNNGNPNAPGQLKKGPTGIIAWTYQLSDDGKSALVELVARDASAFDSIKKLNGASTQVFTRSSHSKSQIESAFKAQRKEFDFKKFGAVVR